MAEEGLKFGLQTPLQPGFSSGLAVVLGGEDCRRSEKSQKAHLFSSYDDVSSRPVEHTLQYILDVPNKSFRIPTGFPDAGIVRSVLRREVERLMDKGEPSSSGHDGLLVVDNGHGTDKVVIDDASICGDIKISYQPMTVESMSVFGSARANACVWKGKWMYEVILETAGIQQLGWASVSCPFTDHRGVGDADDSYSYDGKRVTKWNKDAETYGQPWVAGDVIGCCIDLELNEISFNRNGLSLGVAFDRVRNLEPSNGYYPALSLSQGERCVLNFGSRPFRYPVEGFLPIEAPPLFSFEGKKGSVCSVANYLLGCLVRLVKLHRQDPSSSTSVDNFQKWRRFAPLEKLFDPVCHAICEEFFSIFGNRSEIFEYLAWGPLLSFLLEVFGMHSPHDYVSVDRVLDLFLQFQSFKLLLESVFCALASACKTAPLVLAECPYSGPYPYLALACHILRREELMTEFWRLMDFEMLLEGFLSRKCPNKYDLELYMPHVWWPGSCEDMSSEYSMTLTTTALSGVVSKNEEMQRELCRLVIRFVPPVEPVLLPGSVFRTFLQNVALKNRGADRNMPPCGLSSNSVLVSLYTVILHFLSEGFGLGDISEWMKSETSTAKVGASEGFLHRGGQQSFPIGLFLRADPLRMDYPRLGGTYKHLLKSSPISDGDPEIIQWEEGFLDNEETRVTHTTERKPCCCSSGDGDFSRATKNSLKLANKNAMGARGSISERSAHVTSECTSSGLNEDIVDKPSSSDRPNSVYEYEPIQHTRTSHDGFHVADDCHMSSSESLKEEELLDLMLLFYHLGLAPNFKQASFYMSQQSQLVSLLDETDRQIRLEKNCIELRRLKEARAYYREELFDCVRCCAWYRTSLFSRWKLRGMYAACMWIVQLLLVLSTVDSAFIYIPELYLQALVDCFHALRRSDPPFVSSALFLQNGLASFVTFIVTHFDDPRISSADLRDVLLQSISVLVQYKDYTVTFERNKAAVERLSRALLSAFDNRSWVPVTNILLRLCKGSGFGLSKPGESSSIRFQELLRDACIIDEELFSAFLNRLFNTLSWTITEFSVSVREMQENYSVSELQQRKCTLIFDLSCNLARVLEFFTHEIPQAFIAGPDMNLRRLIELIIFILNRMTSEADAEFFDLSVSIRRSGQSDKANRVMILAPLVGIILNLVDASENALAKEQNDILEVFASMDCSSTIHFGFQYLLHFNWVGLLRGEVPLSRLGKLENFASSLRNRREAEEIGRISSLTVEEDECCCICYSCESDCEFNPCGHRSCFGCITRHLLNSQRCFFCNTPVIDVIKTTTTTTTTNEADYR